MYHLHFSRNLRSLAFVLVAMTILGALAAVWWVNHTGLPEAWRETIERAISKQGAHVKIAAIRYSPLQGIIASDVRVFSDPLHLQQISRLERVILDFEKSKLARGVVQIQKIELNGARLTLPVDPNDPATEKLVVTGAYGTLLMPGNRRFEVRNAHGRIAGIDLRLNARIIGYRQGEPGAQANPESGKHRRLLAKIIGELNEWQFDPDSPPRITAFLEGDVNHPEYLTANLTLLAKKMGKNEHRLDLVSANANITGNMLSVTSLKATDTQGELSGSVDYNLSKRKGRFDIHSSLDIPHLLNAWAGLPPLKDIVIGGIQTLDAQGGFQLIENTGPQIHMTGHAGFKSVILRSILFDSVETDFAWEPGSLFLKNVKLSRPDGYATGKAMIQPPLVRIALETTFPASVGIPLFRGKPLAKVLGDFTPRKDAGVLLTLEGGFDTRDRKSWVYSGKGQVTNYNYRGVPVDSAECLLSLSSRELDFSNGTVVFNYRDYALRKAFKGPRNGTAKVGNIRYDSKNKLVHIKNVNGNFWAAPMLRLFTPKIADNLEKYRFHRPPTLAGAGVVDVTPKGRTNLTVAFNSDSPADYRFLGKDVTLKNPSGKVAVRHTRVTVNNLEFEAFNAPVDARFDYQGNGKLLGEVSWTKLSTSQLASIYKLKMKGEGRATGRVDFSITKGRVETMAGEGLIALEKPELLSIPMFGPLSPLISGALNNRKAGFERANSAFCNFTINKGVLSSHDFRTATPSLTFVGDGSLRLKDLNLDMTMRMNARGLLGLLTLPLRPLYGMFQFRGTGPLSDPEWKKVLFTPPSEKQKQLLQPAPKARIVTEPR